MGLPGVKIGPLDPDASERFGSIGRENTARRLLRIHAQLNPPQLTMALARKRDDERTKALDLEEVREYVSGLKLENGDAILPEGARVTGAAVRGERDTEQILTFAFTVAPSGRQGKWFAPYNADVLPESVRAGDELVKVKEMRDRGIVAWDSEGTQVEVLRRQLSASRREAAALRQAVEQGGGGDEVEAAEPDAEPVDTRPPYTIDSEVGDVQRENIELRARVAQLEAALTEQEQSKLHGPVAEEADESAAAEQPASENPPLEDYDSRKAPELAAYLRSDQADDETRRAVLEYERSHENRKSVVAAAEESLRTEG